MKLLFATGGTGGHLLPAQQLAEELEGVEVAFAGHALSQKPFFHQGRFPFTDIESSGRSPLAIWRGVRAALKLLKKNRPDRVVGFGSFHSLPVLLAALYLRIPIVLYEPNCVPGKVNRLFSPFAQAIALQHPPKRSVARSVFAPLFPWRGRRPLPDQRAARGRYGLEPDMPTVLVFGGSQGAQFLNKNMPEALQGLPYQVLHIRGLGGSRPEYAGRSRVIEYERDMIWAYAAASCVVCRAGAATLSELILYEKPALLIPFPGASGHQEENAQFLARIGGAHWMRQQEVTPDKIRAFLLDAPLAQIQAALHTYRKNREETLWRDIIS